MKPTNYYLVLLLGLSLITFSCSKDESQLTSDESIEVRNSDDDDSLPAGCYNCRVFLSVDKNCKMKATLTKGCAGNVTYQWSTPYGSVGIPNPDASVDGNYCVKLYTDQGCWAVACTNVKDCKDDCTNDCVEVGFSTTVKCQLEVNLDDCDSQPSNIMWSTPLNYVPVGPTVTADVDGVYCAHVVFADGCQYTDCINVKKCREYCKDNCTIAFEPNNAGINCYMDVITSGCAKPLEYAWMLPGGATSDHWRISIQEDGTYCVTVTQPNGCEISDCIDILNCDVEPVCTDFELTWVNFEEGEDMYDDITGVQISGVNEYEHVGGNTYVTNPVAYVAGDGYSLEALFQTDCPNLETVFIRGTHIRDDGIVDFPAQEIDVINGEIHYDWENAMMNGSIFNFPQRVEFHDPFEILWEYSLDQVDWSSIHTSENPLYVTRDDWNGSSISSIRYHTYFRVGCEQADTKDTPNEIIDKIWEVFANKSFTRADGVPLTYYGNWNTDNFYADDLIPEGDGQCSSHSMAFLNCLKAQGINYSNDFVIMTGEQDGSHVGLLVQNYAGMTSPPGDNWAVDSWASGGAPTGLPAGFDIEYVVIPKNGYNANTINTFEGNTIYSEIIDLAGVDGQNVPNPKAYFFNHQIVKLGATYYDVPYGVTYGSVNDLKGSMFGYIFETQATIDENILGADVNEDGDSTDVVTKTVWLIDRDLDDQVVLDDNAISSF